MRDSYDLIVLGGGIAGATLALVLSRLPCNVLVVERGQHPRFAIGESTIPSTTFGFRYLANTYDVPELAEVTHYTGLREHGLRGFPKRHFWFGLHKDQQPLQADHEMLFETFPLPNGPDVHMLRSDVDAFLVSKFEKYGVDYTDQTEMTAFEKRDQGVVVDLMSQTGEHRVKANMVIDASGHSSFFAKQFGLRSDPDTLHTRSRAIFGHFRGLTPLDDTLETNPYRFNREAGTVHHCFDGGWVWAIPFDHDVTSVGFMLNPDQFPLAPEISPEEEMRALLHRFPTLAAHLGSMTPVRPLIRTGRVQFTSSDLVGEGFVLTPHAAAFVEPLFSSGLLLTQMFILRFVPMVQACLKEQSFDAARFADLSPAFAKEIELIDLMVSGMVRSFEDMEMFRQYWRIWIHSTALQFFGLSVGQPQDASSIALAYGAAFDSWRETVRAMHRLVHQDAIPAKTRAAQMKAIMDAVPHPFGIHRFKAEPGKSLQIHPDMDLFQQLRWALRTIRTEITQQRHHAYGRFGKHLLGETGRRTRFFWDYLSSKITQSSFHRHVDHLRSVSSKS